MCHTQLSWWANSNDINSPTHSCDIEGEINNFVIDDKITEPKAQELSSALQRLLHTIKGIEKR